MLKAVAVNQQRITREFHLEQQQANKADRAAAVEARHSAEATQFAQQAATTRAGLDRASREIAKAEAKEKADAKARARRAAASTYTNPRGEEDGGSIDWGDLTAGLT